MTRNSRRNSRVMRRKQVEGMQATIDGLHAMHQRARTREAQARSALSETSAQLVQSNAAMADFKRDLAAERAMNQELVDSALTLVNMVRAECVARPAAFSNFTPRGIHPDQWRFMLQERHFDARQFTPGNEHAKIDLFHRTMYLLRHMPTVHDAINGQIHLRVRLGDGQAAYALSHAAIYGRDECTLAERISKELAPMLVRELRDARRGDIRARAFLAPDRRAFSD